MRTLLIATILMVLTTAAIAAPVAQITVTRTDGQWTGWVDLAATWTASSEPIADHNPTTCLNQQTWRVWIQVQNTEGEWIWEWQQFQFLLSDAPVTVKPRMTYAVCVNADITLGLWSEPATCTRINPKLVKE